MQNQWKMVYLHGKICGVTKNCSGTGAVTKMPAAAGTGAAGAGPFMPAAFTYGSP